MTHKETVGLAYRHIVNLKISNWSKIVECTAKASIARPQSLWRMLRGEGSCPSLSTEAAGERSKLSWYSFGKCLICVRSNVQMVVLLACVTLHRHDL